MERLVPLPLLSNPRPSKLRCLLQTLCEWRRNSRTRKQLAALDCRQLADIGISPSDRLHEISKPFWR